MVGNDLGAVIKHIAAKPQLLRIASMPRRYRSTWRNPDSRRAPEVQLEEAPLGGGVDKPN